MKLPVIALCTMLSAFAIPATADTLQLRTADLNGAPGQARTLLYNGESTDSQLVKDRRHRHRHHHRHSKYRHRHHHHNHGYHHRHHHHRHYYRPYYYRPYYYNPYYYSYPRSGFYFRIF